MAVIGLIVFLSVLVAFMWSVDPKLKTCEVCHSDVSFRELFVHHKKCAEGVDCSEKSPKAAA